MHPKIFRRSSGKFAAEYLQRITNWLNELRHADPEKLYGDAELFDLCVALSGYAQPYLSGVVSFEEDFERVQRKRALACVMSLIRLLAAKLPLSEFGILVVLHRRKHGFDIHFLMAKLHLRTTRQFRFYRDTDADEALLRTWRRMWNLVMGWSDVEDPDHKSLTSHPSPYAKPAERRAHESFDARMVQWVRSGFAGSHAELLALIRSGGTPVREVADETGRTIGIEITYDEQRLTLLGNKYAAGFDYESARQHRATRRERSRADILVEISGLVRKLRRYGSRRARIYQEDFEGGSPILDGKPAARMGISGIEFLHGAGADGQPGTAVPTVAGGATDDGDKANPKAGPHGHAPGVDAVSSLPGGSMALIPSPAGGGPSGLGAAGDGGAGGGEPPAELANGPASPSTGSQGQGHALPVAGRNIGRDGAGRETATDGHLFREAGGGPPGVAHQAEAKENINQGKHHENGTGTRRLAKIIAELLRRIGGAFSDAEERSGRAGRALGALAAGAGREREAVERIGGDLSLTSLRGQGAEEGTPGESPGEKDIDYDYQEACRELGGLVEAIGREVDPQAIAAVPKPSLRPLPSAPKRQIGGHEPTR